MEKLNPEDTLKVPISSFRFRTADELRRLSPIRYAMQDEGGERRDVIITGSDLAQHVRAYEMLQTTEEDELWREIPLGEALQRLACSRRYDNDVRHPVVRTYVLGWRTLHDHVDELATRGAA